MRQLEQAFPTGQVLGVATPPCLVRGRHDGWGLGCGGADERVTGAVLWFWGVGRARLFELRRGRSMGFSALASPAAGAGGGWLIGKRWRMSAVAAGLRALVFARLGRGRMMPGSVGSCCTASSCHPGQLKEH